MVIENRDLAAGTVLVGRYKGQAHRCTVVEADGKKAYALEDGSIFASPSAAASKLMDGGSVNGWRFWSLEADYVEKPAKEPKATKTKTAATRMVRVIKKVPNQKGVPEGQTKFHCSACMESFLSESTDPKECPQRHAKESADELAGTKEADATE